MKKSIELLLDRQDLVVLRVAVQQYYNRAAAAAKRSKRRRSEIAMELADIHELEHQLLEASDKHFRPDGNPKDDDATGRNDS